MSPHVAFVTEGAADVGLGHVSRCLALARALEGEGARATFLVPPEPGVAALLADRPVEVATRPWPTHPGDAIETLSTAAPDVVVVDSYKASPEFFRRLLALGAPVVAVDDIADRPLPVDVVVNGGVAAESLPYPRDAGTVLLLGSRYALLDPGYADLPARPAPARVSRVLVTLGGGSCVEDLSAAIGAADAVVSAGTIDVAAGPFAASELDAAARSARNRVRIHRGRFGLRSLILEADLAVCGAGMTLYELSAAGTPAVIVCMADNQEPNAAGFADGGAARLAGRAGAPGLAAAIERELHRLAGDAAARAAVVARARALVDGRGAIRVAEHLLRLSPVRG
jgi:spore coat polysaccharide biosynthesis predicted glycosyltransferase SpsG